VHDGELVLNLDGCFEFPQLQVKDGAILLIGKSAVELAAGFGGLIKTEHRCQQQQNVSVMDFHKAPRKFLDILGLSRLCSDH
jgi:hypothetical protein